MAKELFVVVTQHQLYIHNVGPAVDQLAYQTQLQTQTQTQTQAEACPLKLEKCKHLLMENIHKTMWQRASARESPTPPTLARSAEFGNNQLGKCPSQI